MKKLVVFLVGAFFVFFYSNSAFAYLDPGTGSMILQSILAAFLFVGTGIGIFWRRIKIFFKKLKKDDSTKE